MSTEAKPIEILDKSFLVEANKIPEKSSVQICERNVALLSDPSELLYESLKQQIPEQILRARAYQAIGTKMTMPYPKREVN